MRGKTMVHIWDVKDVHANRHKLEKMHIRN